MPNSMTVSPLAWGRTMSAPPLIASEHLGWRTSVVRRWRGTDAAMHQPALDHHYIILHLGGSKTIERRSVDGVTERFAVAEGSISVSPAGSEFDWTTTGPIDFAHLYIHPSKLDRIVAAVFDREPALVQLDPCVGAKDPLLGELIRAMLAEMEGSNPWRSAYLDTLFDAAVIHLASRHSTLGQVDRPSRHALAPMRLRRVLEHVEASLEGPISLADLAKVAGLSRFHFSRAFRSAMGETPLTFVGRRRVEAARRLLRKTELPLAEVSRRAGFSSPGYFSTAFKRATGLKPSLYRQQR